MPTRYANGRAICAPRPTPSGGTHQLATLPRPGAGDQRFERFTSPSASVLIADQPAGVVIAEHDGVELERKQRRVDVGAKVPLLDSDPDCSGERLRPLTLRVNEGVARGTGLIIELNGSRGKQAPTRQRLLIHPLEPMHEERTETWLAAIRAQRRCKDALAETRNGQLEHVELKTFLGSEMREEAALGHPVTVGETADRESGEPLGAR